MHALLMLSRSSGEDPIHIHVFAASFIILYRLLWCFIGVRFVLVLGEDKERRMCPNMRLGCEKTLNASSTNVDL